MYKRQGKKIGTQRGTTGYIYCSDDFGDENVVAYDDGLTAVQALNNGQVDAVVIDNAPAQEFVAANPGLKVLDTSYAEEDYAIGMAKGSALEDAVNKALEELKAGEEDLNQEYQKIAEQYKMEADKIKELIPAAELEKDICVEKAINLVRDNANIKDAE